MNRFLPRVIAGVGRAGLLAALEIALLALGVAGCATDAPPPADTSGPRWQTTAEPDPSRWDKDGAPWSRQEREDAYRRQEGLKQN